MSMARAMSTPYSPARRVVSTLVLLAAMRTDHTPWCLLTRMGILDPGPPASSAAHLGPAMASAETITDVDVGLYHACILTASGKVKCWGQGTWQLGYGDQVARGDNANELGVALPYIEFPTGLTATAISCGGYHNCAILSDNTLRWCAARAPREAPAHLPRCAAADLAPRTRRPPSPAFPCPRVHARRALGCPPAAGAMAGTGASVLAPRITSATCPARWATRWSRPTSARASPPRRSAAAGGRRAR